jgi:hypothetical protein
MSRDGRKSECRSIGEQGTTDFVDAEDGVTSCNLLIFVDQSAEPITTTHLCDR